MHDIRKAARVLRLGLPETEVVQAILEGLTPQERSRLIFADRPRCFADFERLCVVSRMVPVSYTHLDVYKRQRPQTPAATQGKLEVFQLNSFVSSPPLSSYLSPSDFHLLCSLQKRRGIKCPVTKECKTSCVVG